MTTTFQPSFNAGEVTKRLGGRLDISKYGSALETCLNALPQPHGGVTRRMGTQYIATCKNANKLCRLIPFEFSTEQAYIIEAGHDYFRYYMDGGQIQTFDAYTKLCLHGDGRNASTSITDATLNHTGITIGGNVKIDTFNKVFPSGSIYFPGGAADYITVADSADWYMAGAAFAIDFWVKFEDVSQTSALFSQGTGGGDYVYCEYYVLGATKQLIFQTKNTGVTVLTLVTNFSPVAYTWYHIAIQRSGSGASGRAWITVSGASIYDRAIVLSPEIWPNMSTGLYVGMSVSGSQVMHGWIDEFRVTKGSTRWDISLGAFPPPSAPYPLSSGGTVYETTHTYTEDELSEIKYTQSADVLYLVHPDHAPATLSRTAHDSWTLADMSFAWPAFGITNSTTITLDPDTTVIGVTTVTSSGALFDANWVGDSIEISDGYINIASVQMTTQCNGTIVETLTSHAATVDWARSAWNYDDGYPCTVMFYEERLGFAGNAKQPQTIWLSISGDYTNFDPKVGTSIADTDACTYTISSDQVNAIRWMAATKKLVVGTTGGEWLVSGNNDDGVTPSNVKVRQETPYGSADMMPIKIGNSVIYVQRGQKKLREFSYDFQTDAYKASDLIILAEHLTRNNQIQGAVFQKLPNQVLWCWLADGTIISLTYLKEHDVIGWSNHTVGGVVESMAVIPGPEEDEVWLVVRRLLDLGMVRYIERMKSSWTGEDVADAFYVDCGITYDGAEVNSVTGLSHLEGELVAILADGIPQEQTAVTVGSVNVASACKIHVGLPMVTDIKTLRTGTVEVQGKIKRIAKTVLRFFESCGEVLVGSSATDADTKDLDDTMLTEDVIFTMPTGYDTRGQVFIRKEDPLPMTILAIIPKLEAFDEVDGV